MTVTELAVAARARAAGGVAVADRSCFFLSRVRRGFRVERVARGYIIFDVSLFTSIL